MSCKKTLVTKFWNDLICHGVKGSEKGAVSHGVRLRYLQSKITSSEVGAILSREYPSLVHNIWDSDWHRRMMLIDISQNETVKYAEHSKAHEPGKEWKDRSSLRRKADLKITTQRKERIYQTKWYKQWENQKCFVNEISDKGQKKKKN